MLRAKDKPPTEDDCETQRWVVALSLLARPIHSTLRHHRRGRVAAVEWFVCVHAGCGTGYGVKRINGSERRSPFVQRPDRLQPMPQRRRYELGLQQVLFTALFRGQASQAHQSDRAAPLLLPCGRQTSTPRLAARRTPALRGRSVAREAACDTVTADRQSVLRDIEIITEPQSRTLRHRHQHTAIFISTVSLGPEFCSDESGQPSTLRGLPTKTRRADGGAMPRISHTQKLAGSQPSPPRLLATDARSREDLAGRYSPLSVMLLTLSYNRHARAHIIPGQDLYVRPQFASDALGRTASTSPSQTTPPHCASAVLVSPVASGDVEPVNLFAFLHRLARVG